MKIAALLCSAWLVITATSRAVEPAISIAIAVPQTGMGPPNEGRRQIVAFDKFSHFCVVLTNLSDQPQPINRGSGWLANQTLHFEGTDAAGKKWEAERVDQPGSHRERWETLVWPCRSTSAESRTR